MLLLSVFSYSNWCFSSCGLSILLRLIEWESVDDEDRIHVDLEESKTVLMMSVVVECVDRCILRDLLQQTKI